MAKLTDKRERFCEEYLVDLNATQAAIRAGYSEKTARQQGQRLLSNVVIEARIAELKRERSMRTQITADRVLEEYARLGFADMRSFASWGPGGARFTESEGLNADESPAVESVKESRSYHYGKDGDLLGETVNTSIKLHSKIQALGAMSKHLGLYDENSAVNVNVSNTVHVDGSADETREQEFAELFKEIDDYRASYHDASEAPNGEAEAEE